MRSLFWTPGFFILLAEDENGVQGGVGSLISSATLRPDLKQGEELFFWCYENAPPSTALRLLRGLRKVWEFNGVELTVLHSLLSSPESIAKAYKIVFNAEPAQVTYIGKI